MKYFVVFCDDITRWWTQKLLPSLGIYLHECMTKTYSLENVKMFIFKNLQFHKQYNVSLLAI